MPPTRATLWMLAIGPVGACASWSVNRISPTWKGDVEQCRQGEGAADEDQPCA